MDNLLKELKKVCQNNSIRLTTGIDFQCDAETKTVTMKLHNGVKENMQENVAAFEGWALALKANLPDLVESIILDWDKQPTTESEGLHFNRFLYRVDRFAKQYGDWFKVSANKTNWEKQVQENNWGRLILNLPGQRDEVDNKKIRNIQQQVSMT